MRPALAILSTLPTIPAAFQILPERAAPDPAKRLASEPLTTDTLSLGTAAGFSTSGFTLPSSETSTPTNTDTDTVIVSTGTPDTSLITLPTISLSSTGTGSTGTGSLTSEPTTDTAGSVPNPTGTATQSLSAGTGTGTGTTSATGTSASATGGAAGILGDGGREGSTVALVVAIGVGLVGWVGL